MEKNNKRQSQKYPALHKKYNLLSRKDLIDYDYLHKLNPEELKFLNDFTEAEIIASSNKGLELSKEDKKEAYKRNNKRNSDFYNRRKKLFFEDFKREIAAEDIIVEKGKSEYTISSPKIKLEIDRMSFEEFDKFFYNNTEFFSEEFRYRYECLREKYRSEIEGGNFIKRSPQTQQD